MRGGTPHIDGLSGLDRIGAGGYSTVFVGTDEAFSRQVAVKVIDLADDAGRRRFERELALMGSLDGHPNVITPYRSGYTTDGAAYLIMEYAANGSLQDQLDRGHTFSWEQAVAYLSPVALALEAAHAQGILHHDIKPANILLTADWVPKLTDFGIASIREGTMTGSVTFTLAHTSPETFAGGVDRRDERSDVYSLASTTFAMVAGRAPFDIDGPDSQPAYLHRIATHPVPSLGRGEPIDRFMTSALDKDPAGRPPSARAFLERLPGASATGWPPHGDGLGGPDTISVPPPRSSGGAGSGAGSTPMWWLALAAVAVLAVIGAVAASQLFGGDESADGDDRGTDVDPAGGGDDVTPVDDRSTGTTEPDGDDGGEARPTTGSTTSTTTSTTSTTGASSTTASTLGVVAPDPTADLEVAERIVLQTADLDPTWEAITRRPRAEVLADYEALSACGSAIPAIRGDGETAVAGREESYVAGNTAVSVTLTFYETEQLASERGPLLVLDRDYQRCSRTLLEKSVSETNPTLTGLTSVSGALPAPDFGQRTEAVQVAASFELEPLGRTTIFLDEWVVQIGRAVLVMTWVSDTEFDPRESQILQIVASRFERELSTVGG
ncbi:MAG: serine/threonine-protein kinase [Actinomycetota bacterium]